MVAKIRCREIASDDVASVANLLARGFPGRARVYWLRGLQRQGERAVPQGCPRYGYLLESDGALIGALLLLYSLHRDGGEASLRCNVSSWYVEPGFRNYATLLTTMAQKNRDVTYVNISPAEQTWPIIEAQGFRRYCDGFFFALPLLARGGGEIRIDIVTAETTNVAGLAHDDAERLVHHAAYGCVSVVCRDGGDAMPFILVPKRIRHGRFPSPAMQLVYSRSEGELVRCARAIGRFIAVRGKPVLIVDANGPIAGLPGVYSDKRGRKYFKGPHPPRLADLTDTEVVLYGP